jgi:hypothetical protein
MIKKLPANKSVELVRTINRKPVPGRQERFSLSLRERAGVGEVVINILSTDKTK